MLGYKILIVILSTGENKEFREVNICYFNLLFYQLRSTEVDKQGIKFKNFSLNQDLLVFHLVSQ